MGIILFWIQYIIAIILLYNILKCIYIKGEIEGERYSSRKVYSRTDNDEQLKHPLWLILVFILLLFIPFINIVSLGTYLGFMVIDSNGSEYCKYYCKSIFTKKY